VAGNDFDANSVSGIIIDNNIVDNVPACGFVFWISTPSYTQTVTAFNNVTFSNNRVTNTKHEAIYGLYIDHTSNPVTYVENFNIVNNVFTNCGNVTNGFLFQYMLNSRFTGNIVSNCSKGEPGICVLSQNCTGFSITENTINGIGRMIAAFRQD